MTTLYTKIFWNVQPLRSFFLQKDTLSLRRKDRQRLSNSKLEFFLGWKIIHYLKCFGLADRMSIAINWFKCRYWVMHRIERFLWMIIDQWTGKRAQIYIGHKVRKLCKFSINTVCFLKVLWSLLSNVIYALCIVHFFSFLCSRRTICTTQYTLYTIGWNSFWSFYVP